MKKSITLCILLLVGVLLSACRGGQPRTSPLGDAGDFANWGAWNITWTAAHYYDSMTGMAANDQNTYLPAEDSNVFLLVLGEFINTSKENQEMRFSQSPIYLVDGSQNKYNLVGVSADTTIFMAPPYLILEDTTFITFRLNDGRFNTLAYEPKSETWFIQATPNWRFEVSFLFEVPRGVSGLIMQFGNGMNLNIE